MTHSKVYGALVEILVDSTKYDEERGTLARVGLKLPKLDSICSSKCLIEGPTGFMLIGISPSQRQHKTVQWVPPPHMYLDMVHAAVYHLKTNGLPTTTNDVYKLMVPAIQINKKHIEFLRTGNVKISVRVGDYIRGDKVAGTKLTGGDYLAPGSTKKATRVGDIGTWHGQAMVENMTCAASQVRTEPVLSVLSRCIRS